MRRVYVATRRRRRPERMVDARRLRAVYDGVHVHQHLDTVLIGLRHAGLPLVLLGSANKISEVKQSIRMAAAWCGVRL